ncbi:MAG: DUF1614 domain-containing protein [Firmicutes bacterium]|nr:DUF1614 domain-containing protein [Bacillota bacterium]
MRLTDSQALLILGLIIAGSFFDVPVSRGPGAVTVNVGGAVVPVAVAIYLLARAETAWERIRASLAALATGAAVWALAQLTDFGPHGGRSPLLDPLWLFSLVGGVVAYALGRSRRAAFVAGTLGLIVFQLLEFWIDGPAPGRATSVAIGGGGFFDAVVLAGVVSSGLAEVVGEVRERVSGGPASERPKALQQSLEGPGDEREDGGGTHA